jgi:hypothetical protein
MRNRNKSRAHVVEMILVIIVFVIEVFKVVVVVKALVLECLAGEVVNRTRNDLTRDVVQLREAYDAMEITQTFSLRSSPIW